VVRAGSTNPSNLAVMQALGKVAVHRAKLSDAAARPVSTRPRRDRPAGRVQINRFVVTPKVSAPSTTTGWAPALVPGA